MSPYFELELPPYLPFLGLQRAPFPVVPDAENLFLPTRLDALLMELLHAIQARKGFMVLTGEVGLGKTTISRRLMALLDERRIATALVFNTFLEGGALLKAINHDFGAEHPEENDLNSQLEALNRFLMARDGEGGNSVIIIDDAQNLSTQTLELVRLISNLETNHHKLVQILLIGQPELVELLDTKGLRQLKSRIVVHAEVGPFDYEELKHYIQFKLNHAGHVGGLRIAEPAYRLIHRLTAGNPRRINILMDRCLYGLMAYNSQHLTRTLVEEVARELKMGDERRRGPGRSIAGLALGFTLLGGLVGIGGVLTGLDTLRPTAATAPASVATKPADTPGTEATAVEVMESRMASTSVTPPAPLPAPKAPSESERFLAAYGLERFSPLLDRALDEGWVEIAGERIGDESGLRLALLPDARYVGARASLPLRDGEGRVRHLIFWRPANWIDGFRYGSRGEAVLALQRGLATLGYYQGTLDGLAGRGTMTALSAFQEANGLPVTGRPDATTQFLVSLALEPPT